MVRKSFSTARAASLSACGSSPVRTRMYFSPEPPRPTLLRTPGSGSSAARIRFSMPCLRGRSPRSASRMVSVALRASAAPDGANGSVPAVPPPMVVYTLFTCCTPMTIRRACSATALVCSSVEPGAQLQVHLRLRVVVGRDEAGGQQRDQRHRADEEQGGQHDRRDAVPHAPFTHRM